MKQRHNTRVHWASRPRSYTALLLTAACLALPLGCAGSMRDSGASADPKEPPEPAATVAAASAMFDAAEAELQAELLDRRVFRPGAGVQPAPAPPQPAAQPSTDPGISGYGPPNAGAHTQAIGDRCSRACRALASMRRSANRVCELDGASSDRCENVQRRVDAARRLVTSICPSCDQ